MKKAGAPPEVIEQFQANHTTQHFEVHPLNWGAVSWFLEVSEQWKWRGPNKCIGLDWLAVEAEARLRGHAINHSDFKKLKVIASEASYLINQRLQK